MNRLAETIDDLSVTDAQDRIPKFLASELEPKLIAYKAEMETIRDFLFGDLIKAVTDWKVPALSFGSMATIGYTAAVTAFLSSVVAVATKPVIDYVTSKRSAARKHAVSYLVGLADRT